MLFHSLAVILSSVNLSFRPGITQQNIKETLILKKKGANLLFLLATPISPPTHFTFFWSAQKPQRVGRMPSGFSPSHQTTSGW